MLLRQMVGNLLENAIRHAKSGGTVGATVRRTEPGVTIRVTDDGAGIPVHEQERIFQRFVRLDSRSHGAGLGLPIARWIAEAHGGRLVLESSVSPAAVSRSPCRSLLDWPRRFQGRRSAMRTRSSRRNRPPQNNAAT